MTDRRRTAGFFRGSELSTLLALGGLLVVVLAIILVGRRQPPPAGPPALPAAELPPLPPPDPAPELQGIQDRTPMNLRDTAAFKLLADRARETPDDELHAVVRRELVYSQFFDVPDRYRGLPVHIEGRARRVLAQDVGPDSAVFPDGRFFEAYVVTPDSQRNPYILAFDDAPPGLPVGDALDVPVSFDGYFLKLMAYRAGDDTFRAAPLIVGRFSPAMMATPPPAQPPGSHTGWPLYLVVALGVLLLIRLAVSLARSFGTRSSPPRTTAVIDQIEPDALSAWIEQEQGSGDGDGDGEFEADAEPDRWRPS